MPYVVKKVGYVWFVIKKSTGEKMSKRGFKTRKEAVSQMQAIGINEKSRKNR